MFKSLALRLLLLVAAVSILWRTPAQTRPTTQPPLKPLSQVSKDASEAVSQYNASIAKLRTDYAEKTKAAQTILLKKLEMQMAAETKRGNLEAALAIRAEISANKNSEPDVAPPHVSKTLQGTWNIRHAKGDTDFRFEDGQLTNVEKGTSRLLTQQGNSFVSGSAGTLVSRFTLIGDRLFFEEWSPGASVGFPALPCTNFGIGTRKN